jgi:hypothetical protein
MKKNYSLKAKIAFSFAALFAVNVASAQVATTHTFAQTTGTFSAISGGTVVGGPTDDDASYGNLNIGFSFKYNGACYTQFGMGSNGYFTFGPAVPNDDYTMLSSGTDNNVISVVNSDIQLGFVATGTVVTGSPTVAVFSSIGIAVGNTISAGYGFPAGTTVTAVSANSFTASANATSNVTGQIRFSNGEMRAQTLGIAPTRTLVVQWLNIRKFGGANHSESFNFQLRLEEATSKISIVFGSFVNGPNSGFYEVGLRGNTNADFNNRTTSTNWSATTAGTLNSDVCTLNGTLTPVNGLTFNWNTTAAVPTPTIVLAVTGNTLNCGVSSATNIISASGATTYSWSTSATTSSINPTTSVTTVYSVVGTGTNGCIGSNSSTVVVSQNPTVTISGPSTVCSGSPLNLTAAGAATYSWNTGATTATIAPTPTANLTYTATGTNSVGCIGLATQAVTVNALPTVSVASSASLICAGQSASLTASGAATYTWNTSSTNTVISVTPSVTTSYTVNGTGANGCANISVISQSVSACTGLNNTVASSIGVVVYPNPNTGSFTIELNNGSVKTIEVMDVTGRIILTNTSSNDKADFNISGLSNGIYYVRVQSNNSVEVIKIVKQ